jgi:predicted nucleotidyltransferase
LTTFNDNHVATTNFTTHHLCFQLDDTQVSIQFIANIRDSFC